MFLWHREDEHWCSELLKRLAFVQQSTGERHGELSRKQLLPDREEDGSTELAISITERERLGSASSGEAPC